ncbi:RNA-directed DNA polymerase, eukaryota, reverse transcriptase zinc-binding domain protein [Tanacetum coccineum]
MTRVQAWQEIVEKVQSRLSKWKSKTLSIGGRLTLLKSVLGSIPVFHMSIFKVPSKVFHILESIRSHFFNGHDPGSKKASWVKWNNWVWKSFTSQKDSLWTKVIVAIHGVGGKIHSEWTSTGKSCWLSILSEVRSLQRKDRRHDLFRSFRRKFLEGGSEQNQFDSLVELVRSVTIVPSADRWNWNLESTEVFDIQDILGPICDNAIESTERICVFRCGMVRDIANSAEAEYRGVANAVAETCSLRNLLHEFHTPLSSAMLVNYDNVSAVYLFSNPVQHQHTKTIEIDIHFVRAMVAACQVIVLHAHSRYQNVDIFTKGLPSVLFEEFRIGLSVRCFHAQTAREY